MHKVVNVTHRPSDDLWFRFCRACLATGDVKFYELNESIKYFVDLLRIELDGLATHWICSDCYVVIKSCLEFAEKVQMVHQSLCGILSNGKLSERELLNTLVLEHNRIQYQKVTISNVAIEDMPARNQDVSQLPSFKSETKLDRAEGMDDGGRDGNTIFDESSLTNVENTVKTVTNAYRTVFASDQQMEASGIAQDSTMSVHSAIDQDGPDDETDDFPGCQTTELHGDEHSDLGGRAIVINLTRDEQLNAFEELGKNRDYISAPYKCKLCYRGFTRRSSHDKHILRHSEEFGGYECDLCHLRFRALRQLKPHIVQHTRLYKCTLCNYRTFHRKAMMNHHESQREDVIGSWTYDGRDLSSRLHDSQTNEHFSQASANLSNIIQVNLNKVEELELFRRQASQKRYTEAVFKCKLCFKGFLFKDTYLVHMEKHSKFSGDYECDMCHIFMQTARKMQSHRWHHSKVYRCRLCGYTRSDRSTVIQHYQKKHDDYHFGNVMRLSKAQRQRSKAECCHCGVMYSSRETLVMHIRRKHAASVSRAPEAQFKCDACKKRFRFRSDLKLHSTVHLQTRDFYCVECDFWFKTQYALTNHLKYTKRHVTTEAFVQCLLCPMKLVNKQSLKHHTETIHVRTKRFGCDKCPKAYSHRNDLNKHLKSAHIVGERERKHVCDLCGKSFLHKKYLVIHMNVHTGDRPYKCLSCEATFMYPAALYTHNRLVHLKIKRKCDLKRLKGKLILTDD